MSKKRGNSEGSIYKTKNDLWRGSYTVHTAAGVKRKYLSAKTRKEVSEKLTKAMADRDGGLVFDAGTVTVAEYLERWLTDSVRDTVRQRTYEEYVGIVERHLSPTIGRVKLKSLTPSHVRGLYREKLDSGLAPRTVQYIHRTLTKALKQAVGDSLIPRNVCEAVKPPQPRKAEISPLDTEQVRALLDTVSGERVEALYTVAVSAGLRQGELLGLRWEDIDLEAGTLQVRRTASEARTGLVYEAPKSGKGRPDTALPEGRTEPQSASQAPARGEDGKGRAVGGSRPRLSLGGRDSARSP